MVTNGEYFLNFICQKNSSSHRSFDYLFLHSVNMQFKKHALMRIFEAVTNIQWHMLKDCLGNHVAKNAPNM